MTPPARWYAASVCGTPLPRTSGKTFASSTPVTRLTSSGTANSRSVRRSEAEQPVAGLLDRHA